MIDTHSHIYGEEFAQDCDDVVQRAFRAGVSHIFLPNINMESIQPMLSLCDRYPGRLHPMMGLHPSDVNDSFHHVLSSMEALLADAHHPYVAVGEVGYHLPLVIHVRSAHRELLDVMTEYSGCGLRGIFHCFGGTLAEATQLLSYEGFCLGIGGVLTFKKSTLPDVLSQIPLSRVVLETDSPYLAPVPYRGQRNESAYVAEVLRKVADVYGMPVAEVERQTDQNAKRIFTHIN